MDFSKNKKLIYLGAVLAGAIIIGIVLFTFFQKESSLDGASLVPASEKTGKYLLDASVLETSFFESLTRYGKFPIEVRFPGRKNPFEPY